MEFSNLRVETGSVGLHPAPSPPPSLAFQDIPNRLLPKPLKCGLVVETRHRHPQIFRSAMADYIFNADGTAQGFRLGSHIYTLDGTPVGRAWAEKAYRLDGTYVGAILKNMVVDKPNPSKRNRPPAPRPANARPIAHPESRRPVSDAGEDVFYLLVEGETEETGGKLSSA